MTDVGKTYYLKDGSGFGTVVGVRYVVRVARPGKPRDGGVGLYDEKGVYVGALMFEVPDLVLDKEVPAVVEEPFKL